MPSGTVVRGATYRPTANFIGTESRCGGDPIDAQTAMAIARAARMVALTGFSLSRSIFDSYPSRRRGVPLLSMPSARSCHRLCDRDIRGTTTPSKLEELPTPTTKAPAAGAYCTQPFGQADRLNANTVCSGRSYASAGSVAALRRTNENKLANFIRNPRWPPPAMAAWQP